MKNTQLSTLLMSAALMLPLALAAGCSSSHEISHSESNKTGWFGGQTHEANTVYKNSDGSTSVESETTTEKNGTTTITRERKTTQVDGSVKTEHETRTIVKGTDSSTSETHTSN